MSTESSGLVNVMIHGASGRMGQALLRLATGHSRLRVVSAVTGHSPPQRVVENVAYFAAKELASVPPFDVVIDFSLPEGFSAVLEVCLARGKALVSGTTGLSEAQRHAMRTASQRIPVLWASNFSFGVAVLEDLVQRAALLLSQWDCDIVESHHIHKKDAPSGTALTLGQAAEQGGAHPHYASLRAGDIVGEHLVQFTGLGERVELTHRATSRDIFARGALHAAIHLVSRKPGLYRLKDLLD